MTDSRLRIEPHRKAVEIRDGKIVRMWWQHSRHDPEKDDFDHEAVLERWQFAFPGVDPLDGFFLRDRHFSIIIIDGKTMPDEYGRKADKPGTRA